MWLFFIDINHVFTPSFFLKWFDMKKKHLKDSVWLSASRRKSFLSYFSFFYMRQRWSWSSFSIEKIQKILLLCLLATKMEKEEKRGRKARISIDIFEMRPTKLCEIESFGSIFHFSLFIKRCLLSLGFRHEDFVKIQKKPLFYDVDEGKLRLQINQWRKKNQERNLMRISCHFKIKLNFLFGLESHLRQSEQ